MPVVINQYGFAKVLTEEAAEQAIRAQDCRLAIADDWRWLDGDKAYFQCPWITEHERGCMGDRTMLIIGAGESMNAEVEGAYRLICNPRYYSPPADAIVAIDSVYWTHGRIDDRPTWVEEYPHHLSADLFCGPAGPGPHIGLGKDQFRFGLPLHPLQCTDSGQALFVRVQDAIKNVNLSGVCAWLIARYLSTGPVIFTGFPLKGVQIRGEQFDYERTQIHSWRAVAPLMTDTYLHPECEGPLRELYPVWRQ